MKVNIRSILVDAPVTNYYTYELIDDIVPCCADLKDALSFEVIEFSDGTGTLSIERHDYTRYINFCPFCGEKIEYTEVEKKRRKAVQTEVTITRTEYVMEDME
jgi:dGTP triphosphohydrolase